MGAPGSTAASLHSSSGVNNACDKAISPLFKRGAGATSVVMAVRHDIEAQSQGKWWDRANVHAVNATTGVHTLLTPTGRLYDTDNTVSGVCHIGAENGWAGNDLTWGNATFSLAGLTGGQEYYLEVNYNTDGAVAPTGFWFDQVQWNNVELIGCETSTTPCVNCTVGTTPGAPTGLTATATLGKITLNWTAPGGSPAATSYRIYRSTTQGSGHVLIGTSPTTTYDDTTGVHGEVYYYVVRAVAASCESTASNEAWDTDPFFLCTDPGVPADVTASATVANQASISWTTNGADSYEVFRATTSGGPYTSLGSVGAPPFVDAPLSGGDTFYYAVRAHNAPVCDSDLSAEAAVVVLGDCNNEPQFSGVQTATPLGNGQGCGTRVAWNAGTAQCAGGSLTYNVYRSTTSGFVPGSTNLLASCVGGTSFDDTTTTLGTTYHYVVRAEDAGGIGGGQCGGGLEEANTVQISAGSGTWTAGAEVGDPALTMSNWSTTTAQKRTGLSSYTASGVNVCGMLTSPSLTLDLTAAANLTFYLRRALAVHQSGAALEAVRVEISTNGGASWSLLAPTGGYTHALKENVNNGACSYGKNDVAWIGGTNTSFVPFAANLTAYQGQTIRLRWVYVSGATTSGGAWVDDILVTTVGSCTAAPQAVSFLTATGRSTSVTAQWVHGTANARVCRSTVGFPADPGNTACPAGVSTRIDEPGTANAADLATFTSLASDTAQFLSAFGNNGSGVFSGRRTAAGATVAASGNAKWAFATGAAAMGAPLQWSGVGVYAASNDRALYAMTNGESGGIWPPSWKPGAMNGPAASQPLVLPASYTGLATDAVFVASQDGYVYCFQAATGAGCAGWTGGRASYTGAVPERLTATPMIYYAAATADRRLIVGTRNTGSGNALIALRFSDGGEAWRFTNEIGQGALADGTDIGLISGPVLSEAALTRVYFTSRARSGGSANTVWGLTLADGSPKILWARAIGDVDGSFTRDYGTSRLLVGTNAGGVYSLVPATGADGFAPRFFGDGAVKTYVYYSQYNARLSFATATKVWSVPADGSTGSDWSVSLDSPTRPTLHFGTTRTYVGACADPTCTDGRLVELDGANAWTLPKSYDLPGAGGLGQVIVDRGQSPAMIYVGSRSGRVYAVTTPLP